MNEYYFDNAASTRPYKEVSEAVALWMSEEYANPSSLHKKGMTASSAVSFASKKILDVLALTDRKVIFTSGATESANAALRGVMEKSQDTGRGNIITTSIEHPCVSEVFRYYAQRNAEVRTVGTDRFGQINPDELEQAVDSSTRLVSFIWVNNEFGSVQPVQHLAEIIKKKNSRALIHLDAVQGFGKVHDDLSQIDMISLSAHKFHGPKGVGALVLKNGISLAPIILGGGQQDNLRSGTINAPGIYGCGTAAELTALRKPGVQMTELRNYLYGRLESAFGSEIFNTLINEADYAPHIINISLEPFKGEVMLHMLEESGIYVSTASACSSHKKDSESVLLSLGMSRKRAESALRISLSEFSTKDEADYLTEKLLDTAERLRSLK